MMKAGKLFILLTCFCVAFSCSRKAINLDPAISNSNSYVIVELEKADLYFSTADVLTASEVGIAKETNDEIKNQMLGIYEKMKATKFDTLRIPLMLKEKVGDKWNFYAVFDLWYHGLLRQGKVRVYNKSTDKFESKIICERVKTRFGNVSDVFTFRDGTQFYDEIITIGN